MYRRNYIRLLIWFYVLPVFISQAQSLMHFNRIDFPGYTRAVFQDSRGFTWFATKQGVFRYDGVNYTQYVHRAENSSSISSNEVWSIAEDADHYIWFGTQTGGISRYDYATDSFTNFLMDSLGNNSLHSNEVLCIAADRNGFIWAATSGGGIVKITKDRNSKSQYRLTSFQNNHGNINSIASNKLWSLTFDNNNYGYAGTLDKGLVIFNASEKNEAIKFRKVDLNAHGTLNPQIDAINYDASNKTIWILSGASALFVLKQTEQPLIDSLAVNELLVQLNKQLQNKITRPLAVFTDSKNYSWLSSDDGALVRFKLQLNHNNIAFYQMAELKNSINQLTNLSSEIISSFTEDRFGNIWAGCEKGVLKYNIGDEKFQAESLQQFFTPYQKQVNTAIIENQNGDMIMCSNNPYIICYHNNYPVKVSIRFSYHTGWSDTLRISSVSQLRNDDYLFASNHGVIKVDKSKFEQSIDRSRIITVDAVNVLRKSLTPEFNPIAETDDGHLFIGTSNGLYEFFTKSMQVEKLNFSSKGEDLSQRIRTLLAAPGGQLWIGTDLGIFVYDYKKKYPVLLNTIINNRTDIAEDYISEMEYDSSGLIWIGTNTGLFKYEIKTKRLTPTALKNTHVTTIEFGSANDLWVGTFNGLYKFNTVQNSFLWFNKSDGLLSSSFFETGSCRLSNGMLVFCGNTGINYFNPDSISSSSVPLPLLITDFEINFKSVFNDTTSYYRQLRNSLFSNQVLDIGSDQKSLKFEFAALNYLPPEKNRYQYQLEGFDNMWNDLGGNSFAYYSAVKPYSASLFFPGIYTFKVRLINPDGSISLINQPLRFTIKPYWAKSIEFYSLLSIAGLGLIVYVVRYLSQQKLKEKVREQEKLLAIERERNRISEDLHDDLGAGLSSIAMMTGVMKDLVTDDTSKQTAEEVSTEATELVARMREIIWSMNSKNDTLENLIQYIRHYAERYLEKNSIECKFTVTGEIPLLNLSGDKRENLFLVVKETLHNTVKYAMSTSVALDVKLNQKAILIRIADNGQGFDMSKIGKFGNGLSNMNKRIENTGGQYLIQSEPDKGTITQIKWEWKK